MTPMSGRILADIVSAAASTRLGIKAIVACFCVPGWRLAVTVGYVVPTKAVYESYEKLRRAVDFFSLNPTHLGSLAL